MNNVDLDLAALAAQKTRDLLNSVQGKTAKDAAPEVSQWADDIAQLIPQFGLSTPIELIKQRYQLSPELCAFLCLVLLPEVNSSYADFYSLLYPKGVESRGTLIDQVLTIISANYTAKSATLADLQNDNPLFYWQILLCSQEEDFLNRSVRASGQMLSFLDASADGKEQNNSLCREITETDIDIAGDSAPIAHDKTLIHLVGSFTERQLSYALKQTHKNDCKLFALDAGVLSSLQNPVEALRKALLAVSFANGHLFIADGVHFLTKNELLIPLLNKWQALKGSRIYMAEERYTTPPPALNQSYSATIELPDLTYQQDEDIWSQMADNYVPDNNVEWAVINQRYTLNFPRLKESFNILQQIQSQGTPIDTKLVMEIYKATSPKTLAGIAQLNPTQFSIEDMVLTAPVKAKLEAIQTAFAQRKTLNTGANKGFCCVFDGHTGSGKSMAAEALSNELGLPLYHLNYSLLTESAGDQEQNLNAVFEEAETYSAALLLDEADALLSQSPQDSERMKMLNGFVTTKIQNFKSLLILTTRIRKELPASLLSKVHYSIHFSRLDAPQRMQIIENILKQNNAKLEPGLTAQSLAYSMQINGHTINNILRNAIVSAREGSESPEKPVVKSKDINKAIEIESL